MNKKEEAKIINHNKKVLRNLEIIKLKEQGYTQEQAAIKLNISIATVKRHWYITLDDCNIIEFEPQEHIKGNHKNYEQYKVNRDLDKCSGVYKITKDNMIYIGSTCDGFRRRFIQHLHESNKLPATKQLLDDGGIFEIQWMSENNETENFIRKMEIEYIRLYSNDKGWICVNSRLKKINKPKYKNIKILALNYDKAIEILKENNLI